MIMPAVAYRLAGTEKKTVGVPVLQTLSRGKMIVFSPQNDFQIHFP